MMIDNQIMMLFPNYGDILVKIMNLMMLFEENT